MYGTRGGGGRDKASGMRLRVGERGIRGNMGRKLRADGGRDKRNP